MLYHEFAFSFIKQFLGRLLFCATLKVYFHISLTCMLNLPNPEYYLKEWVIMNKDLATSPKFSTCSIISIDPSANIWMMSSCPVPRIILPSSVCSDLIGGCSWSRIVPGGNFDVSIWNARKGWENISSHNTTTPSLPPLTKPWIENASLNVI